VTMAAIIVTLVLGGPAGPALIGPGWLWGVIWFFVKLIAFLFVFVWIRGTVPRVRYDQLMDLGWKVLIPLSLGWFLLLAALREFSPDGTAADSLRVVLISLAAGAAAAGLLALALRVSGRARSASATQPSAEGVGGVDRATNDRKGVTP